MQSSAVSFTSGLQFVRSEGLFDAQTGSYLTSVPFPWTFRQIQKLPSVITKDIASCTAGGIITKLPSKGLQGDKPFDVVMFHLDPDNRSNANFNNIKDAIYSVLEGDKPMQGFLLGAKNPIPEFAYKLILDDVRNIYGDEFNYQTMNSTLQKSADLFGKMEEFFKELKIPFTKFKGLPFFGKAHIGYSADLDKWTVYLSNFKHQAAKPLEDLKLHFDEVSICEKDFLA